MGVNDFAGMRQAIIRNNATGAAGSFNTLTPDKIGSDGLSFATETNEMTTSSFAGDRTTDNGTNLSASTLSVIFESVEDLAAVWPEGYDEATGSWGSPIGGCSTKDADVAFEKVCDTKGNILFKHCSVATAFSGSISRDEAFTVEVNIYPQLSPGSEYGLSGDAATEQFPFRFYDGRYDPSTGTVTYDAAPPSGGQA